MTLIASIIRLQYLRTPALINHVHCIAAAYLLSPVDLLDEQASIADPAHSGNRSSHWSWRCSAAIQSQ
jgi:hypothetical protein